MVMNAELWPMELLGSYKGEEAGGFTKRRNHSENGLKRKETLTWTTTQMDSHDSRLNEIHQTQRAEQAGHPYPKYKKVSQSLNFQTIFIDFMS